MLTEISEARLIEEISEGGRTVILTAPNYESRSISALARLLPVLRKTLAKGGCAGRVRFVLLDIRRRNGRHLLEELIDQNQCHAGSLLSDHGFGFERREVRYPIDDPRSLQSDICDLVAWCGSQGRMVVDMSCLPRAGLVSIMETLVPHGPSVASEQEGNSADPTVRGVPDIVWLYCWAQEYPRAEGPAEAGLARAQFTQKRLHELLRPDTTATAVLLTSGGGHDAITTYEYLLRKGVSRHIFFFLSRDALESSLYALRANQHLINQAAEHRDRVNYCFTPADISRRLRGVVREAACQRQRDPDHLFLVAPYGPKPLTLAAYLAAREYEMNTAILGRPGSGCSRGNADIIIMSRFQMSSVYSLGTRSMSVYRMEGGVP